MDYYGALAEALIDAEFRSYLPTELTRDQMLNDIDIITTLLKGSLPEWRRIVLCADRQELRLRLRRAEQVAQRLLGGSNGKDAQG